MKEYAKDLCDNLIGDTLPARHYLKTHILMKMKAFVWRRIMKLLRMGTNSEVEGNHTENDEEALTSSRRWTETRRYV